MEASKRSRTIDIPAIMRAVHQREDAEPKLLVDPIAAILVDLASADPTWLAPLLGHAFAPQWRAGFLIRG